MSKNSSRFKLASTAVMISSLALASSTFAADYYQVIDLGTLNGSTSEAFSVNDNNDVVGVSNGDGFISHAFVYRDANQELVDLGFLDFENTTELGRSAALGISGKTAVGYSRREAQVSLDGEGNAVLSEVDFGVYFDVDSLTINEIPQYDTDKATNTVAVAINQSKVIVGTTRVDPPDDTNSAGEPLTLQYERGFIYNINTQEYVLVEPLQPTQINQFVVMRDINDDGLAVGVSSILVNERNELNVLLVNESDPTDVEAVNIFGGQASYAWAVNNSGVVVGKATLEGSLTEQAFLYDSESKVVTGLGYLNDSFKASEAIDINESNQIVGRSRFQNSPAIYHAFIYEDGVMKDLNKLIDCDSGWILNEARAINDSVEGAVITGTGIVNGEKHGFMLKPLEGTAPSCEVEDDDSGSGSLPAVGLIGLLLLGIRRLRA